MKKIKPLSAKQIDNAKAQDKDYRLYDGDGLSLLVKQTSKIWHFSYQRPITKKRTIMSLGSYPSVTLSDARQKRDEYRSLLAQGIDPQEHNKQQALQQLRSQNNTFFAVSQEWLSKKNYKKQTILCTKRHLFIAYQYLENIPVNQIKPFDIISTCEDIAEKYTPLLADKVKGVISQSLDYALAKQMIEYNPAKNLVRTYKKHQTKNHPAITEVNEFRDLLKKIKHINLKTPHFEFLQITIYLFVRENELKYMNINDIDFDNAVWKYTPSKTENKTAVQMIVPLPKQVIHIIQNLVNLHGKEYVFPSMKYQNTLISPNYITNEIKTISSGKQTLHGLRATARTILEEVLEYDPKYIEMQLGHQVKDPNGTAYNRAKYLKQRTEMIQKWADFIDELKKDENNT